MKIAGIVNKAVHFATLAALGMGTYSNHAGAIPVVIQDPFVQAGVSDFGTLGSNVNASPGIRYDPSGTGTYGINDLLTPGDPMEGFHVTAVDGTSFCALFGSNSYCQHADNSGFVTSTFPFPTAPVSLTGTSATWTATSIDGTLRVTNNYALTTIGGRTVIDIVTTLTALRDLTGVQFLRTLDPDPDLVSFGSFSTNNSVLSSDQACATGQQTGQTICIFSDSSFTHQAGVSAPWSRKPADYLSGLNDGNGDYAIGIGFDLGNFKEGQSKTICYDYVLGASLDTASGNSACLNVPEPASALLIGAGLAGLGVARRRKNVKDDGQPLVRSVPGTRSI